MTGRCPMCSTTHKNPAKTVHDFCPVAEEAGALRMAQEVEERAKSGPRVTSSRKLTTAVRRPA